MPKSGKKKVQVCISINEDLNRQIDKYLAELVIKEGIKKSKSQLIEELVREFFSKKR